MLSKETLMSKEQSKDLFKIIISAVIFFTLLILEHKSIIGENVLLTLVLYLIPYFLVGYEVVRKCFINISHGQVFDECFLMTLATVGAFGCQEFSEAVAVMLFYQVGEFFQDYAVNKSRNSITELMSITPDFANREIDGKVEVIDPDDIEIGDVLVVKPGEKIPTDGTVLEGQGTINTAALTGESMPRFVKENDTVISGCVNGEHLLKIRADKAYDESTVMQILELIEDASARKSKTENFITKFAKYYTPIVVIGAVILAFLPPLISGNFTAEFSKWLLRACTFLVISCPCALVISIPLAFFGGIGACSKNGVLIKGSNYLEQLSKLNTVVSDKTGTLTKGNFEVNKVFCEAGYTEKEVLKYAASIETFSSHPIATAIVEMYNGKLYDATDVENIAGKGIKGKIGTDEIYVGRVDDEKSSESTCSVIKNNEKFGTIYFEDAVKPEAVSFIKELYKEGVKKIVMLTGDADSVAKKVANSLNINNYFAELLPQDKVRIVEDMLNEGILAFIGDGVNDAPVLARADVGIAMGSLGSDAAIEAADVVIMDDDLSKIPSSIRIAKKTVAISKSNIVFALFVKFLCLILGAIGIANMWVAVFADVGVAVICILNSMRLLRSKK